MSFFTVIDPVTELVPQFLNNAHDALNFMLTCKSIAQRTRILHTACPPERLFDILTSPLGADIRTITFGSYGRFYGHHESEKELLESSPSADKLSVSIIVGKYHDYIVDTKMDKLITVKLDRDPLDGRIPIKRFMIRTPKLDQEKIDRFLSIINPEKLYIHVENWRSAINVDLSTMTRMIKLNLMNCSITNILPLSLKNVQLTQCKQIGCGKRCFEGLDLELVFIECEEVLSLEGIKHIECALFSLDSSRMMPEVAKVHDLIECLGWNVYYQHVFTIERDADMTYRRMVDDLRDQYNMVHNAYTKNKNCEFIYDEWGGLKEIR